METQTDDADDDVHRDTMEILKQRLLDDIAQDLNGSQEDCNGQGTTEKDWKKVTERRGFAPILRENTLKMLEISTMLAFQYNKSWYACLCCRESFMTTYMLREHMVEHTLQDIERKIVNQQNRLVKVEISLLKCKLCEKSNNNSSLDEFRDHLREVHRMRFENGQDLLVPFKLETEGLKCQMCSETFETFRLLNMHANTHFLNRLCDICGKSFTNLVSLNLHRTRFHKAMRCSACDLTFESLVEKRRHNVTTHANEHHSQFERKLRFPCQYCSERFSQESLKVRHLVDKHGVDKPEYKCAQCPKVFITRSLMNNHVKNVHLKERNHECDVCRNVFYTRSNMLRHKATHTREKKFSCTLCNRAFSTRDSLQRHLKRDACVA